MFLKSSLTTKHTRPIIVIWAMEMLSYETISNHAQQEWVVFLHGAGGSTRTWKEQIEEYGQHFQLLLIDLRDHGNSKGIIPAHDSYTLDIVTADIFKLLDHLGIRQAHFVTLSMGSFIMQSIILKRPEIVSRCVLAGAVILGNWRIRTFAKVAFQFNKILAYKQMYTIFSFLLMPRKHHQRSRSIYRKQADKLSKGEYLKWLGLYNEFFKLLKRFSDWKIHVPTMLLMGSQDYVFYGSALSFSEANEQVLFDEIPQSGHICNIDNSTEFNQKSLAFLLNKPL